MRRGFFKREYYISINISINPPFLLDYATVILVLVTIHSIELVGLVTSIICVLEGTGPKFEIGHTIHFAVPTIYCCFRGPHILESKER